MRRKTIRADEVLFNVPPLEIKYAKIKAVVQRYGTGRFTLFELIRKGEIRTVLYKGSKKAKGYRLVDLRSLEDYLNKHASGGEPASSPVDKSATAKSGSK
jgi:hypothetical protein